MKLYDLANIYQRIYTLEDEDKILKAFKRIENHIEFNSEDALLNSESNICGLISLYSMMADLKRGSDMLAKKMESMLETELKNKKFKVDSYFLGMCMKGLAIKRCINEKIWQPILTDIDQSLTVGGLSNIDVYDLMRSLHAVGFLDN